MIASTLLWPGDNVTTKHGLQRFALQVPELCSGFFITIECNRFQKNADSSCGCVLIGWVEKRDCPCLFAMIDQVMVCLDNDQKLSKRPVFNWSHPSLNYGAMYFYKWNEPNWLKSLNLIWTIKKQRLLKLQLAEHILTRKTLFWNNSLNLY